MLLDNKKTAWNQLPSKQSFFLLQPFSSAVLSLVYSTRSLTHRISSPSLVRPRLRRYCLRDVTHTALLVHFAKADSAFQIYYRESYPFAEKQLVYSTAPADRAIYILGWIINDFLFFKWRFNYANQTSNILNATGNHLIKESLHQSFTFQL